MILPEDFLSTVSWAVIGVSLLQGVLGFGFGVLFARWSNLRAEAQRWQARRQAWSQGRPFILAGREGKEAL